MVDLIRANAKLLAEDKRGKRRLELLSKGRGILDNGTSGVTLDMFNSALKSLEQNTKESLHVLKKAFVQDPTHIVKFLRHKSALHFVVGRLISRDPYEQLEALECCCNAALGDAKSCHLVAKASGIYIIQIVHGTNANLMNVALPTLGNLTVSSTNASKVLHEQGIIAALLAALKGKESIELAAKTLCQFVHSSLPFISDEDVLHIANEVYCYFEHHPAIQWLIAELSTRNSLREKLVSTDVIPFALNALNSVQTVSPDNLRSITAFVRLLGNMSCSIQSSHLTPKFIEIVDSCNYLFLKKELKWLLSRIYCVGNVDS